MAKPRQEFEEGVSLNQVFRCKNTFISSSENKATHLDVCYIIIRIMSQDYFCCHSPQQIRLETMRKFHSQAKHLGNHSEEISEFLSIHPLFHSATDEIWT